MRARRFRPGLLLASAVTCCAIAAGCTSVSAGRGAAPGAPVAGRDTTASSVASTSIPAPTTTTVPAPTSSAAATTPTPPPPVPKPRPDPVSQLPRGGRQIFPAYRVVAYYGGPDGPALGVLGSADPDTMAAAIAARAATYAPFGRTIQPAMELIATVARPCTGDYPTCSGAIPSDAIRRYLDAAHRHKLLLILDFQPGRGEFLPQVQAVEQYLTDPSVSVALDPEWKLGPGQFPMQVIGSSSAASINAVSAYLSRLVVANRLPDKLLVVHQFTLRMLPDRRNIVRAPGLETVFHADGFGVPASKTAVYARLGFPGRPFRSGFKLFFSQDHGLMSPASVMALRPQPDIVTYQ